MPEDIIFSGPARIQITDFGALRAVHTSDSVSSYEPVGFDGAITLHDHRQQAQDVAWLTIAMTETAVLTLTLSDAERKRPTHALWLGTGPRETATPRHPLFMQIAPLPHDQYAYLALFRLSKQQRRDLADAPLVAAAC